MNGLKRVLILAILSVLAAGCATTDNPREGGLFSYNPEAYERRLEEREAELSQAEENQDDETGRADRLERELAGKQGDRDALKRQIAGLDRDILDIETLIKSTVARTREQEQQLWRVNVRLGAVKRDLKRAKSAADKSVDAMKKEVVRLNRKLDELMEEAEQLSKM